MKLMLAVLAALAVLNFAAFVAFGIDKARARDGRRRIPEARLLQLALLGGSPGAYAGRRVFRHKTRKQPFVAKLHTIAVLQLVAAGVAGYFVFVR
jgi:uncharacterized membrane protein YsdA (DUF1294 family)